MPEVDHSTTRYHIRLRVASREQAILQQTTALKNEPVPSSPPPPQDVPAPESNPTPTSTICARWTEPFRASNQVHPLEPFQTWDPAEVNNPLFEADMRGQDITYVLQGLDPAQLQAAGPHAAPLGHPPMFITVDELHVRLITPEDHCRAFLSGVWACLTFFPRISLFLWLFCLVCVWDICSELCRAIWPLAGTYWRGGRARDMARSPTGA